MTPDVKATFTEKLKQEPREFFGHKIKQVVCTDGLQLICQDGSWIRYRLSVWGSFPGGQRARRSEVEFGSRAMDLRVERRRIRSFPKPEEQLRTLVERAPDAEAWADRTMERFRPTFTVFYGIRRRIATGAVALLAVWLFVHVMFGANGMIVYRQKKAEYQHLQKEVDTLQKANDTSSQEINSLQNDPKMIEKEAREQLHYARPGEVIYVAPPPPPDHPSLPESKAAQK